MRWPPAVVVAAYVCAVVACLVVLLDDAHFVVRYEQPVAPGARIRASYGCFASTVLAWRDRTDRVTVEVPGGAVHHPVRETRVEPYAETSARLTPEREAGRRLMWAGATLFVLACATPLLGLWALCSRRAGPTLQRTLVLLVALAPLAVLESIGFAAGAKESADPLLADVAWSLRATTYTWWARFAWSFLALAILVSWRRLPRKRKPAPVDPEVFE